MPAQEIATTVATAAAAHPDILGSLGINWKLFRAVPAYCFRPRNEVTQSPSDRFQGRGMKLALAAPEKLVLRGI